MGVSGIRFNRPKWEGNYHWMNPTNGQIGNYMENIYNERKQWNIENQVIILDDIRRQFGEEVTKPIMDHFHPPGSGAIERRAPRKGIISWVIAGLVVAAADNQYLTRNSKAIAGAGETPMQALATMHGSKAYPQYTILVNLLDPAVTAGGEYPEAIRLFHDYITRWLAANDLEPSRPAAAEQGGIESATGNDAR
jgi:hypothetical protein